MNSLEANAYSSSKKKFVPALLFLLLYLTAKRNYGHYFGMTSSKRTDRQRNALYVAPQSLIKYSQPIEIHSEFSFGLSPSSARSDSISIPEEVSEDAVLLTRPRCCDAFKRDVRHHSTPTQAANDALSPTKIVTPTTAGSR